MRLVFFVSSFGDTDLAKSTIGRLIEQKSVDSIFVVPLTATAVNRTEDLIGSEKVFRVSLNEITQRPGILLEDKMSREDLDSVKRFIDENKIQRAYVGVPSADNTLPYEIAGALDIPLTVAYEYLFKSLAHPHRFFDYVDSMASKPNCDFAVPLTPARDDILAIHPGATVYKIGHLSLDNLPPRAEDTQDIRASLLVEAAEDLVVVSGTTQPTEIDNNFLDALLMELSTGKYPTLQLRMSIHPGINNPALYIQTLLQTCEKYPQTSRQFKIIITDKIKAKLEGPLPLTPFIMDANVEGPTAAKAADRITQAVPGALLNQAAMEGTPAYFPRTSIPYLPEAWFSKNISSFFTAARQAPHSREELGLEEETAPALLASLMTR
ncbi:MAG: Uncharacterized protein K0S27_217 [Gammaproteobacteria bacterium]|jgi:hypothetical protein|nr:Uncharacterized protein [Gammaproteobacteria bacterium]